MSKPSRLPKSEPVEAPPEVIEPEFELAEAAAETAVPIVPPAPAAPATAAEPQRDAARPAHAAGYRRETPPRVAAAGAAVRGLEAYEREDFVTAFDLWSGAARNGGPEAQYRLGQLYQRGQGVIANLPDAVLWYCRAAEQGHAEAQYQLSLVYQRGYGGQTGLWRVVPGGGRERQAHRRTRPCFALPCFPNGLTIERDETALRWSLAAAQHGHAEAQANTGQMYARGIGCEPDYAEAGHWYGRAAEQGNAAGEFGIGVLYANGFGVERDLGEAAAWIAAPRAGHDGAQLALGLGICRARASSATRPRRRRCCATPASAAIPGRATISASFISAATASNRTSLRRRPASGRRRARVMHRRC